MKHSRPLPELRQHRLDLPPRSTAAPFAVSACNAAAVAAVEAFPDWPNGALALIGPEASGKTRLAGDWARRCGAHLLAPHAACDLAALGVRPVLVDDAIMTPGETLFHLLNRATAGGGPLLLTGRTAPATWPAELPDLRSRFNALAVADLGEPDDAVLPGLLAGLLDEAGIRPAPDLFPYLLARIERSAATARRLVSRLDAYGLEERREVDRRLAKRILDAEVESDLFT